ncbi:hypothetical protein PMAYCL1PPCAC_19890, partial [Pristionchus mayeri]
TAVVIYKINKNRLKRLESTCDEYTLSIKYQLLENARAFKLLLHVSTFASITVVIGCAFLVLDIHFVESDVQFASMMGACFDAIISLGSLICLCIIVLFEKEWRSIIVSRLRLNKWVEISRDSPVVYLDPEESVSTHFAELEKCWNKTVAS